MEFAARFALVATILIVAATVHVVSRAGGDRQLFSVMLGRERTSRDRASARRVQLVNVVCAAFGIAFAIASDNQAVLVLVASVLPILPVGWMLVEMTLLARSLPAPTAPARWLVPLDEPPSMRQYVSLPLIAANVAVVLLGAGAFAALRPALPERMAMQFDGRGNVSRWGSPAELWLIFGIELFNLALLAFITWSVSAERWALPENEPARYAAAQLRRRRLIVRLVETLMLGINLSTTLIWLGLAVGALPGYGGILAWAIVAGVTFTGLAVILPLVGFIRPLARVQKELAELAGTHVLGTRATGWRWAGMIYYAPEDPALFVPKFRGIGQTLNFARPMSWVLLIGSIAVPLVLSAVVLAFAK